MSFLRRWWSRERSDDPAALGDFLLRQANFVAQKTVHDYVGVKLGRDERRYLTDPDFQAALRHCRWQVWFGTIADVTRLAEAWLRGAVPGREGALARSLVALHAEAYARVDDIPEAERETAERALAAFPAQLAAAQADPPWPAHKLPLLAEAPLLATLPIHADQRMGETPAIKGALRFHMVSTQQEMERAFDRERLARRLAA